MRKLKHVVLLIIALFWITSNNLNGQDSGVTWDFPIKPGMQEWKKLNSHIAMVDICQVPADILPNIQTDDLVTICLDYPLFFTMTAFNNLQEGFNQVSTEFNGFQELFKRKDAGKSLIKKYQELEPKLIELMKTPLERGHYKYRLFFMEFILAQQDIITLTDNDIKLLLSETLIKLDQKGKHNFSLFNTQATLLIICRILEANKYTKYEILNQKDNKYLIFSKSFRLSDKNMIKEIKTMATEYLVTM